MKETQQTVWEWTLEAFPQFNTTQGRAVAIVEEAIELALAAGMTPERIREVIEVPIKKQIARGEQGDPAEESADLLSCIYAYAGQANFDVHEELDKKMELNRSRPIEYYQMKTAEKIKLGLRLPTGG